VGTLREREEEEEGRERGRGQGQEQPWLRAALLRDEGGCGPPRAWCYKVPGGVWGAAATLAPSMPRQAGERGGLEPLPFSARSANQLFWGLHSDGCCGGGFERDCFGDGVPLRSFHLGQAWGFVAIRRAPAGPWDRRK